MSVAIRREWAVAILLCGLLGSLGYVLTGCRQQQASEPNTVAARGSLLWVPVLPDCIVQIRNAYWVQTAPYSVETTTYHLGIAIQKGTRKGSVDQYQLVVLDIAQSQKLNPKFWKHMEPTQVEQLRSRQRGYYVMRLANAPESARGWVKLGNVWLMLVGDYWVVELLAKHYISEFDLRVKGLGEAKRLLGSQAPDTSLRFLVEYGEAPVARDSVE